MESFIWILVASRHMAAVELPVSRRFLSLGRITSCWVPLRGDTFKAAALSAAGATSGDRLHTLPEALHFFPFSFSLSLFSVSELIFHRLAVDSARLRGFTDFQGKVAAIWQRLLPAAAAGTRYRCLSRLSHHLTTVKTIFKKRHQIWFCCWFCLCISKKTFGLCVFR